MLEIKFVESRKMEKEETGEKIIRNEYEVGEYSVREYLHFYVDGSMYRNFDVFNRSKVHSSFAPAIHFENALLFDGEEQFKIQTTSYGALNVEDFEEFMAAQKQALDVVKSLNTAFIK